MEAMISIKNLSFCYPDGKQALQNINLDIHPGEKVALVGANGAGKSTLLLHLNGIFEGEGKIVVNGAAVEKKSLRQIRGLVGMVFQNPDDQLFSSSVYEDVAYGPVYQGHELQLVKQKVEEALQSVHMSGTGERNPYHMSSGEKKRVAIATVLAMDPRILVFDEPSAGLDPRSRRELIELLKELPQTMVIATHDLDLAIKLTTRTVILNQGKIATEGPTESILHDETLLANNGLY